MDWILLAFAFLLTACVPPPSTPRAAAARLESRLLAPCCWVQTLDTHESPLASGLRTEIGERLEHGETAERVEADLVARYGARIRAVPAGFDVDGMGVGMFVCAALMSTALLVWQGRRRRRAPAPAESGAAPDDGALAARLDDELDAYDD